ncbi:hypothetical protein LUZ60_002218 [Juncus effusus]|nr:hypothetical protein LUZ60_002218 [Juncus effusus]
MERSLAFPISICIFFSFLLFLIPNPNPNPNPNPHPNLAFRLPPLRIYVADLPTRFNYGLLDQFWSLSAPDSRLPIPHTETEPNSNSNSIYPPYPDNPLIRQYSAEYWLLGDLEARRGARREDSVAIRVFDPDHADVIFVPFFAALSAEMQLGWGNKGDFFKKDERVNLDYKRQKEVLEIVKGSKAWKRSAGHDHVFVLTGGLSARKTVGNPSKRAWSNNGRRISKRNWPGWLVEYLRGVSGREIERLRGNLAKVQRVFEFGDGENGAVEHIWKMVQRRVPMVEEAVWREKMKLKGVEVPLRCHCTR